MQYVRTVARNFLVVFIDVLTEHNADEPFPYQESLESLMHTPDIAWQPKHYKGFYDKRMTRILEERKAKNMDERAGILALIKAPQPAVQSDDSDKASAAPVKNNQPVENDELVENNEAVVSASLPASHESHTMESSPSPPAAMGMPVPTSSRSSVDHNGPQASARRATNPSPAPSAKHQRPLTLTEDGNPAKKMKPENRSRFRFIVTRKGCEDLNSNEEDNAISGHHKANRSDSKVRLHIKKRPLTIVSESSPDDIKREQPASVRVFIKSKSVVEPINRKWSSLRRLAPDSRDDWASMVRAGHGMMSSPYDEPEVYRVIKKQPVEDENE